MGIGGTNVRIKKYIAHQDFNAKSSGNTGSLSSLFIAGGIRSRFSDSFFLNPRLLSFLQKRGFHPAIEKQEKVLRSY